MPLRVSNLTPGVVLGIVLATGALGLAMGADPTSRERSAPRVIHFRTAAIEPVYIGVMGATARPGVYQFAPGEVRLDNVLSVSGGLRSDASDFVRVVRNGRLSQMIRVTDASRLENGDLVIVPTTPTGSLVEAQEPKQGMDVALINVADRPIIVHFTNSHGTIWQVLSLLGQRPAGVGVVTMIAPGKGQGQIDTSRPVPRNAPQGYGSLVDGCVIVFQPGTVDLRRAPDATRTELLRVFDVSKETASRGSTNASRDAAYGSTARQPRLSSVDSGLTSRRPDRLAAANTPRHQAEFGPRITPGPSRTPAGYDLAPDGSEPFADRHLPPRADRPSPGQFPDDGESIDGESNFGESLDADRLVAEPADSPGSWQTRSSTALADVGDPMDEEIDTPDALSPDTASRLDPNASRLAARTPLGARQRTHSQSEPRGTRGTDAAPAPYDAAASSTEETEETDAAAESTAREASTSAKSTSIVSMLATPLCLLTVGGILLLLHQRANRMAAVGSVAQKIDSAHTAKTSTAKKSARPLSGVQMGESSMPPITNESQLILEPLPLSQGIAFHGRANPHEQVRVDAPHGSTAKPHPARSARHSSPAANSTGSRSAFERALFAVNQGRP